MRKLEFENDAFGFADKVIEKCALSSPCCHLPILGACCGCAAYVWWVVGARCCRQHCTRGGPRCARRAVADQRRPHAGQLVGFVERGGRAAVAPPSAGAILASAPAATAAAAPLGCSIRPRRRWCPTPEESSKRESRAATWASALDQGPPAAGGTPPRRRATTRGCCWWCPPPRTARCPGDPSSCG